MRYTETKSVALLVAPILALTMACGAEPGTSPDRASLALRWANPTPQRVQTCQDCAAPGQNQPSKTSGYSSKRSKPHWTTTA